MTQNVNTQPKKPFLYASLIFLQCLLWGVGNPVVKIGLETMSPFWCMTTRYGLAFLLFLIFFGKQIIPHFKREYLKSSVIIGLFTAASFSFSTFSLMLTQATISGFLLSLSVVFTPILSFFILRQKTSKRLILIIFIVVVGMYFLCGNGGAFSFGAGEICALLSALTGAGMLTYSSKHVSDIGPFALSAAQCAVTAIVSFILALIFEDIHSLTSVSAQGWICVIYLAVACTCIAYSLQNIALRRVSAIFVSLAFCSEPVFTAIASYIMLKETLSAGGFFGAVLIAAGIVLASVLPSTPDLSEAGTSNDGEAPQGQNHDPESPAGNQEI